MKPVRITMLSPTHLAFEFKISKERLHELRVEGSFPEPDLLRPLGDASCTVPYWKRETVSKFLKSHPEEGNQRSFTCPFCNDTDAPRSVGATLCLNCESIQEMVHDNKHPTLAALRGDWRYINDLREMYGAIIGKSSEWSDEGYVLWIVYRNFNSRAVCIEAFAKQDEEHLYDCIMMTNAEALEFLDNPQWDRLLKNIKSIQEDREILLEALKEQLKNIH